MRLIKFLNLWVVFGWNLLVSHLYAAGRISNLIATYFFALFRKIRRIIKGNDQPRKSSKSIFSRILDIERQISARAIAKMIENFSKDEFDAEIYHYFLKLCTSPKAPAQLIASVAQMAINMGKNKQAFQLFDDLITRYPFDVSSHQQIGVKAFLLGEYELAETIWTRCSQHREKLITELGLDKYKVRFLAPSWFLAIGHIAHLDIYLKHKILSGRGSHKTYYSLPLGWKMPNAELMKLWSQFISPATKDTTDQFTPVEISLLQDQFWSLHFEDGKSRMFSHAGSLVQHRWVTEGREPLVSRTDLDTEASKTVIESLGIPKGSWYVCLHVREPGFHNKWHKSNPGTRNADVMTYLPAIREVVARGGYVIRMGDASMRPLPKEKGIVDYALSDLKSEFMDLFLCASCKFFIGTNSGLGLVPPIFGVPCAMTNWSPICLPQWYPNDTYIPKLIYSAKLGRLLTYSELLFSKAGWLQFEKPLAEEGMTVVDNSAEEIKEFVLEMLAVDESNPIQHIIHTELGELGEQANSYRGAKLSYSFISRYKEVLGLKVEC